MDGYWFKSTLFSVTPGEDEGTSPHCYGKQLAQWLADSLTSLGYTIEEIVPEDWGWCVICNRADYLLWVGCGSEPGEDYPGDTTKLPDNSEITWHCFPVVEIPFFHLKSHIKKIIGALDTQTPLHKLDKDIYSLLSGEPEIKIIKNHI